jgi:hypothetical protein
VTARQCLHRVAIARFEAQGPPRRLGPIQRQQRGGEVDPGRRILRGQHGGAAEPRRRPPMAAERHQPDAVMQMRQRRGGGEAHGKREICHPG